MILVADSYSREYLLQHVFAGFVTISWPIRAQAKNSIIPEKVKNAYENDSVTICKNALRTIFWNQEFIAKIFAATNSR